MVVERKARCPNCGLAVRVSAARYTRRSKCPKCATKFIPAEANREGNFDGSLFQETMHDPPSEQSHEVTTECESVEPKPPLSEDEAHSPTEQPTRTIGRFQILEKLGQGAVGVVYRAYDPTLERVVALKVPLAGAEDDEANERFLREGRSAAALRHNNIVSVFEIGQAEGTNYIAAEFVEGQTLSEYAKEGQVSFQAAAWIVREIAGAVAYAHEQGVIHRDIKPQNILVDSLGRPKLADFGLAKRIDRDATVTHDGSILGSPAYMSPEQARGEKATNASDQYSLGVVLFQLLTGRTPYTGNQYAVLLQVANATPLSPRSIAIDVPEDLDAICRRCTNPDPSGRYPDVSHLAADLDNWLEGRPIVLWEQLPTALEAAQPSSLVSTTKQRSPRWVVAAGFLAVNFLLLTAWLWFQFGDDERVEPAANPANALARPDAPEINTPQSIPEKSTTPSTDAKKNPAEIRNSVGMAFVRIPKGASLIGSPRDEIGRKPNEALPQKVGFDQEFYLAKFETTRRQFGAFVQATGYQTELERSKRGVRHLEGGKWSSTPGTSWRNPGFVQTDDDPVVGVTFFDAVAFCLWLSEKEKQSYRLPMEAEWEYACRAGTTSPWSQASTIEDVAKISNVAEYRLRSTKPVFWTLPVGRFPPNPFDLHDMYGNVAEWCMDEYLVTPAHAETPRFAGGIDPTIVRVIRGGSWDSVAADARSASREARASSYASSYLGFRVVRMPSPDGRSGAAVASRAPSAERQPPKSEGPSASSVLSTNAPNVRPGSSSTGVVTPSQKPIKDPEQWFQSNFGSDLKQAITPKKKSTLAAKILIKLNGLNENELVCRGVLIENGLRLAADACDTSVGFAIIDLMASRGSIDELESKAEFLEAVARNVSARPQVELLAGLALEVVRYAVVCERFDLAARLAQTAEDLAAKLNIGPLGVRARQTSEQIKQLEEIYLSADGDIARRAFYLCFGLQDWEKGLSLLAKSAHLASVVARADLAAKSSQEMMECAQLWLDYASEAAEDAEKIHFALRAADLLDRAQKASGGRPLGLEGKRVQASLAKLIREQDPDPYRFDRLYSRRWLPGYFPLTSCKLVRHQNPYKTFPLGTQTVLKGVPRDSGVFLHPPDNSVQQVVYALPPGYVKLSGWVGLSDLGDAPAKIPSPVRFTIHGGDWKPSTKLEPLWTSPEMASTGLPVQFEVSISGLKEVTLTTRSIGTSRWARACFADVYLHRVPRHLTPD